MTLWLLIIWVVISSPILVFPEMLWRTWPGVPVGAGVISLALAAWVSRDSRFLSGLVSAFGVAAVVGWWLAREHPSALSHFGNLALGILVMCAVPRWARNERRLLHLAMILMGLTALALGLGLIAADFGVLKLLPVSASGWLPQVALQLPGLAGKAVNRNVVGILSVVLMPVAYSVARAPRDLAGPVARGAAWALFGIAAVVALVSQSLTVWIAAWTLVLLAPLWIARRPSWRLSAAALALAVAPLIFASELLVSMRPIAFAGQVQFDPVAWTSRDVGLVPQATIAPDGTLTGTRLIETAGTGQHALVGAARYQPGTYSFSVFAKSAERSVLMLSDANSSARFDLRSGRISDEAGLPSAGLTPASNGWVRCTLTFTATRAGDRIGISLIDDQGAAVYDGREGAGLYLWNPSIEQETVLGSSSLGTLRALAIGSGRRSLEVRREIWSVALGAIRGAPWFGVGFNAFRHEFAPAQGTARWAHAHNILLQTMLDTGVFGLILYVALIVTLLLWAHRVSRGSSDARRIVAAGAALALVGIHVFGMVDAIALGAKVGMLQWLAAGLVVSAMDLERQALEAQLPSNATEPAMTAGARRQSMVPAT